MFVKQIFLAKRFLTELAVVRVSSREVDIFNVVENIALLIHDLSTDSAHKVDNLPILVSSGGEVMG